MAERKPWYDEECMLGIDEAGRGPVLGPMVYGCVYCPIAASTYISSLHFADSKTLNESKREDLLGVLKNEPMIGWAVDIILPQELSASMLKKNKTSLNTISQDSACKLIKMVLEERKVNLKEIYVDTVGDPVKYEAWLGDQFPSLRFTVRKKADSLFAVVSAASIVAKVTRDNFLKNWNFDEKIHVTRNFGSGYPGDPTTKEWLEHSCNPVFGFPSLVRFSWATCETLLEKKAVHVQWDLGDDPPSAAPSSKKRKTECEEEKEAAPNRFSFFRTRNIQRVTNF